MTTPKPLPADLRPVLRDAFNVADLKKRDAIVRRFKGIRANAVLEKGLLEHWNQAYPDEEPFSTAFEDAVIAWCDGKGPMPTRDAGETK